MTKIVTNASDLMSIARNREIYIMLNHMAVKVPKKNIVSMLRNHKKHYGNFKLFVYVATEPALTIYIESIKKD